MEQEHRQSRPLFRTSERNDRPSDTDFKRTQNQELHEPPSVSVNATTEPSRSNRAGCKGLARFFATCPEQAQEHTSEQSQESQECTMIILRLRFGFEARRWLTNNASSLEVA
jgi:hypothetical protein